MHDSGYEVSSKETGERMTAGFMTRVDLCEHNVRCSLSGIKGFIF